MIEDRAAPRVLAISSQVVYGPVGNSAAVPAMRRLGLDVLELPSVLLSNHPGHGMPARQVIGAEVMNAMLARIASYGWLNDVAAVMTGYFVDAAQVEVTAEAIAGLRQTNASLVYLCDPILGDDHPGLYVPEEVALAIRSRLLPLADIVTPNRFELAWLAGAGVTGPDSAVRAAQCLSPLCLATSVPLGGIGLATMLIGGDTTWFIETRRRAQVPNGTGDLLSGLFLAHMLGGREGREALSMSLGAIEAVLDASEGSDALDLAAGLDRPIARLAAGRWEDG